MCCSLVWMWVTHSWCSARGRAGLESQRLPPHWPRDLAVVQMAGFRWAPGPHKSSQDLSTCFLQQGNHSSYLMADLWSRLRETKEKAVRPPRVQPRPGIVTSDVLCWSKLSRPALLQGWGGKDPSMWGMSKNLKGSLIHHRCPRKTVRNWKLSLSAFKENQKEFSCTQSLFNKKDK